jgi:hypothetical protein
MKYHGYIGHIAFLKTGKAVKIKGGDGHKLFVEDLDGNVKMCYHSDLQYVCQN